MKVGDLLDGRYLITKRLGRGGMGAVYKAVDQETETELAVKVLLPELAALPDAMRDLKKEVATAQQLTHQNLLRVNYLGTSGDRAFLIMEYIEGDDLEAYRLKKGGQLSETDLRTVASQLLVGLDYLHERGIVHLDIKPQNIMVSRTGEVKLTDFGISRTIKEQLAARDQEQTPVGTLCYMAPEQLRGEVCDRRADIYALGIMFYQLIRGEFPFPTTNREEVVAWHLGPEFTPSGLSRPWDEILRHCLARKAANRISSCAEIVTAINCLSSEQAPSTSAISAEPADHAAHAEAGKAVNLLALAESELDARNTDAAEGYYKRVLEVSPTNTAAWFGRARAFAQSVVADEWRPDRFQTVVSYLTRAAPKPCTDKTSPSAAAMAAFVSELASSLAEPMGAKVAMNDQEAKFIFEQRLGILTLLDLALAKAPTRFLASAALRIATDFHAGVQTVTSTGQTRMTVAEDLRKSLGIDLATPLGTLLQKIIATVQSIDPTFDRSELALQRT